MPASTAVVATTAAVLLLALLTVFLLSLSDTHLTSLHTKSADFAALSAVIDILGHDHQDPPQPSALTTLSSLCTRVPWRVVCLVVVLAGALVGAGFLVVWLVDVVQASYATLRDGSIINNLIQPATPDPVEPVTVVPSRPPPDVVKTVDPEVVADDDDDFKKMLDANGDTIFFVTVAIAMALIFLVFKFCQRPGGMLAPATVPAVVPDPVPVNVTVYLNTGAPNEEPVALPGDQTNTVETTTVVQKLHIEKFSGKLGGPDISKCAKSNMTAFFNGLDAIQIPIPAGEGDRISIPDVCDVYTNDSLVTMYRRIKASTKRETFILMCNNTALINACDPNISVRIANIEDVNDRILYDTFTSLCSKFNLEFSHGHKLGE